MPIQNKSKNKSTALRRAKAAPLVLLLILAWTCAAELPVTPGSVQEMTESNKMRLPITPPQVVLPVQQAPSQHDPRARRFRVNAFYMSGNTVYRTALLKRQLEGFVDLELNLYDLNKAADTITAYYHSHGYTLARAVIPAQKVENGIVNIRIIEGRFGKIAFSGNHRFSNEFLADRTQLLAPGSLVTTDKLENNLLLMNDIPGLSVKAVMEPGSEFGATDAEIQVKEKLLDANITVNNFGREETGQNKMEIGLNINSPFGLGDQLALSGSSTNQKLIRYWKAAYSFPLNTVGTRLAVTKSTSQYDVSGALAALGINGKVETTNLTVTHPFVRSRADNQSVSVDVKRNRLVQNALGSLISDTTIDVLTSTYLLNHISDDTSVTNLSLAFASNFKKLKSATQQNAMYARSEMDLNYTSPFVHQWDLYLRANYVFSPNMLPDTEKFSLGGPGSVRGFRSSEVRGDTGYLTTMELRRPFVVANNMGVFRVTADAGEVIYKMPGFSNSRDRLHSIGLGASLYPTKGIVASIDVAKPVGSSHIAHDRNQNHRIWMSISASF